MCVLWKGIILSTEPDRNEQDDEKRKDHLHVRNWVHAKST